MSRDTPDISVILLSGSDPTWAADTLRSLAGQSYEGEFELILVHKASPADLPRMDRPFPVRRMTWESGDSFGRVRAEAVRAARAPIVAFLEDHCWAESGWLGTLAAAFQGTWAGVGGEPHNGNPGIGISDGVAVMNFAPLLPPAVRGPAEMIMGHNSAYKREVLMSYGKQLEVLLRSDSVLNMKLTADGHRLLVEPGARISHANESTLSSITLAYLILNRSISATRADVFGWGRAVRIARAALWPLVPIRRLAGLLSYLVKNKPDRLGTAVRYAPIMLVAWTATGLGQALGCLFGLGGSDAAFLEYETGHRRVTPDGGLVPPRPVEERRPA